MRKIDEELIAYAFSQQTSVGLHLLKPMDERGSGLATNVTFGIYREPSRYHAALEFALISPLDRDTYAQNEFVASKPCSMRPHMEDKGNVLSTENRGHLGWAVKSE